MKEHPRVFPHQLINSCVCVCTYTYKLTFICCRSCELRQRQPVAATAPSDTSTFHATILKPTRTSQEPVRFEHITPSGRNEVTR
jgi:hypothetical protein